ncbi:histidine kinase, partial [Camelimonas abortus]
TGAAGAADADAAAAPAPQDPRVRRRSMMLGGALAVALAMVAGVAYWANKVQEPSAPAVSAEQAEAPAGSAQGDQKFSQRVERPQAARPAPAVEAQRAILYEETPDNPQTPRVINGSVKWRLDSENPGPNQPIENVIRAEASFPEAGLNMLITLRKNTDPALPASHLMELVFRPMAEGEGRVVRDVGVPQFKAEENARGAPLAGLPVAVSSSVFLVGLSNLPNDVERNVNLILNQPWIDVPIRYDNGRRAVIALEKGAEGERVIREAFDSWKNGG